MKWVMLEGPRQTAWRVRGDARFPSDSSPSGRGGNLPGPDGSRLKRRAKTGSACGIGLVSRAPDGH